MSIIIVDRGVEVLTRILASVLYPSFAKSTVHIRIGDSQIPHPSGCIPSMILGSHSHTLHAVSLFR